MTSGDIVKVDCRVTNVKSNQFHCNVTDVKYTTAANSTEVISLSYHESKEHIILF